MLILRGFGSVFVLSKISIIPFEGATEGRELYRETKLSMAIEQMKVRNYNRALQKIRESKLWPDNLGVGKPYDQEIDLRLEDWMSYLCYRELKNKTEAEKSLRRITQFVPRIDNTVSNFHPANHLITAWAIQQTSDTNKANEWLNDQITKLPGNKTLLWAKETFNNGRSAKVNNNDPTIRLLNRVSSLRAKTP
jgi:hypothetical protein